MNNKQSNTLRLIYPQWQGGNIAHWMPDLPPNDASRGYHLGAHLLNFLAPHSGQQTIEVPISLDAQHRETKNGIISYTTILKQTQQALSILQQNNPQRIITLGGDCSVSIVPFTYLATKYPDDVAIIWLDAHPDINLPGDQYQGYHAMALTACLGIGDKTIQETLPAKYTPTKALLVGVRSWDTGMKERQAELGIKQLTVQEVQTTSTPIIQWLKQTKASKVVIHFDLDVLDPTEIIAAVGTDPQGLTIDQTIRIINDIASNLDLVGLTIAEHMPRTAIKIQNMLYNLPLLK